MRELYAWARTGFPHANLCTLYSEDLSSVSKTYPLMVSLTGSRAGRATEFGIMALLDFARRRPTDLSHAPGLPNRTIGASRQQSRVGIAVEVGKTILILMLIAVGIAALRCVLVVAHGVLH